MRDLSECLIVSSPEQELESVNASPAGAALDLSSVVFKTTPTRRRSRKPDANIEMVAAWQRTVYPCSPGSVGNIWSDEGQETELLNCTELEKITFSFLDLCRKRNSGTFSLSHDVQILDVCRRRLNEVVLVLESLGVVDRKEGKRHNHYEWKDLIGLKTFVEESKANSPFRWCNETQNLFFKKSESQVKENEGYSWNSTADLCRLVVQFWCAQPNRDLSIDYKNISKIVGVSSISSPISRLESQSGPSLATVQRRIYQICNILYALGAMTKVSIKKKTLYRWTLDSKQSPSKNFVFQTPKPRNRREIQSSAKRQRIEMKGMSASSSPNEGPSSHYSRVMRTILRWRPFVCEFPPANPAGVKKLDELKFFHLDHAPTTPK